MRNTIPRRPHARVRGRRGSILIASVILVVIAGIVALSWLGFVTHSMQASVRDRERLASLYAAEAGIEMIVDFFNNPDFADVNGRPDPRNLGVLMGFDGVVDIQTTSVTYYISDTQPKVTVEVHNTDSQEHPPEYVLTLPELREGYLYGFFEPFVQDYSKDFQGVPIDPQNGKRMWDDDADQWINDYAAHDLVGTRFSFFFPGPRPMEWVINEALDPAFNISQRSKIPSMTFDFTQFGDGFPEELQHLEFRFGRDERNAQDGAPVFARLESVQLIHPSQVDQVEFKKLMDERRISGPVSTKVIATGISRSGIRTTVESYLVENRMPDLGANAALMAQEGVIYKGQTNIHWGEVWTYGDHKLGESGGAWTNQYPKFEKGSEVYVERPNEVKDPWFAHRLAVPPSLRGDPNQHVYFRVGTDYLNAKDSTRANQPWVDFGVTDKTSPVYTLPLNEDYVKSKGFENFENLRQNEDFTIMPKEYASIKEFVLEHMPDSYYFTDTQNRIWGLNPKYGEPGEPQFVHNSFLGWFDATHLLPDSGNPDSEYWEFNKWVTFIDSIPVDDFGNTGPSDENGMPIINSTYYPRDPTKENDIVRMADLKHNGGSVHTRGAMFVAAETVTLGGTGNSPGWEEIKDPYNPPKSYVVAPNLEEPTGLTIRIAHNGLFHSWGSIDLRGNNPTYGSVHADEGFSEAGAITRGTPSIYYNYRMKDPMWMSFNQSRVRREVWDIAAINILN